MKLRLPNYYKDFHCIADKCKDSCCSAGWEIDIDKKTLKFYKEVSGDFGKKLLKNIDYEETPHFKIKQDKNCPFLNNQNLCEIYIKLGENNLCDICKEHPRFYEYFLDIKEGGIGLCCEESARIILSQAETFSTYEMKIPLEESDSYNEKIYTYLCKSRKSIFSYLENEAIPLSSKIRDILWYSHTLQQNIDFNLLDDEKIISVNNFAKTNIEPILEFLTTLEANNQSSIEYLKNNIKLTTSYSNKLSDFENSNPEIIKYLENVSIYFIWRYFLKGTFDEDILSKVKLMVVSIAVIKFLFFCKWLENGNLTLSNCIDIAKRYSEEIEYSESNLNKLAEASYNLECFNTEYLLGII